MSGKVVEFTPEDVSAKYTAVRAQLDTGFRPPMVTGHPKHNSPRVGSVVDAKIDDRSEMWVKVDELTPEFAESCRKGEYVYNSPAFYSNGGLRHLGILGGWNPAMKDQPALEFGEGMFAEADAAAGCSADDVLMFASPEDWGTVVGGWLNTLAWRFRSVGRMMRKAREAMIEDKGVEAADKIYPDYEIRDMESVEIPYDITPKTEKPAPAFGDPGEGAGQGAGGQPPAAGVQDPPPPAPSSAVVGGAEQELRRQLDEANRRLQEIEAESASKAFGERLDKATQEGRLSPVLRTALEGLYNDLKTSGELAFGEADPVPVRLSSLVDALPKVVEFGEFGDRDVTLVTTKPNPLVAEAQRRAAQAKEFK